MLGNSTNMGVVSAGKLFEYFGTRKPIIATVPEGVSETAAKQYEASYITEPDNIEKLKNLLVTLYNDFHSGKLPTPNEEFVLKHDRKYLTEQLVKDFQFYLKAEE